MALIRRNKIEDARNCFSVILQDNPKDEAVQQAIKLDRFDDIARRLAEAYRTPPPVAA